MSGFFNSLRNFASGAANAAGTASRYEDDEGEDTRMKFSLTPQPGESGFIQWLDAMKMVAKLQGGIPAEFRRKLWLTLAERHLEQRRVDWKQAEKLCFNEWSNPDDEELGIQIVKDLHRTGCSLFCGAAGRDNQAVLRRVLLGFARWNKSVGYCQGLNVLAALILQVVDRDEAAAVKVMIYLIEGVLPEGYFADSLRGLSVDMAVFRDLLRMRMPRLSRHLESLQNDAKDKATGSSYEPPLTNVFTMQWFLTLFCHCLPQDAVLRVWDLIFLEGDDVLLRTALAIWEGLSDRIMTVTSADEFYSIMGVLTREMLEFTDTNHLVKTIVSMGPLNGVTNLREKHRYNITPWARRLSDDDDSDTEDDERLAVAAAAAIFAMPRLKKSDRNTSSGSALQAVAPTNDRERLALDISTLKQQYVKLRERQRQAHIILSAACARQSMVPSSSAASQAMNHLLVGKSALVSSKGRPLGPTAGSLVARTKAAALHSSPRSQIRKDRQQQQGVTIHWKDMKKRKGEREVPDSAATAAVTAVEAQAVAVAAPVVAAETSVTEAGGSALNLVGEGMLSSSTATTAAAAAGAAVATPRRSSSCSGGAAAIDSDSDSTSTELCDEPDRLSDVDSEELTSTSDCYVMATTDDERLSPAIGTASGTGTSNETVVQMGNKTSDHLEVLKEETSIAEITDQIRRLSADDADFKTSLDHSIEEKKSSEILELFNQSTPEKKPTVLESFDIDQPTSETKLSSTTLFDFEERKLIRISSLSDDDRVTRDRDKLDNTQTKDEYGISSASHLETTDTSYGSGSVSRLETTERNYGSGSASRLKSTDDTYGSSSASRLETTDDTYDSSSTSRLKSTDDSYVSSSASRLKSTDDSYGSSSASRLKSTDDNCISSNASRLETIESNYVSGSASRIKITDDTYDSSSASRLETTDDRYGSRSILRLKSTDDTYGSISASRLETTENNYVSGSALRLKSTDDTYSSSSASRLKSTDDTYGSSSALRLETTDDSYVSSSTSRLKSTDNTYGSSSATRLETTDDSYGSSSASRLKSTDDSYQNSSASRLETTEINYDFLGLRSRVGIDGPKLGIGSATIESVDEKSSEVNGSVPMVAKADVGDNIETTTRSDVTYSTRSSYVIGHLPIAPMSVEARKNCSKVSPDTFVSRDEVGAMRDRLERDTFTSSLEPPLLSPDTKFSSYKLQLEPKRSPKTPESTKSFSSGETMGPDSVTSSLAVSPKTPLRSDSRNFALGDKSMVSSVSSDSKTLTIRSIDSEVVKKPNETSGDKSVTPSTDSLMQVKSTEPPCSSTESFCSPTKLKSSERSFSSDLQSPISANSIKYTANYSYKSDGIDLQKPSVEIGPVTSPFYPILNPNQKTPSPYGEEKSRTSRNVDVLEEFRDITQDRDMKQYLETKTPTQAFDVSKLIHSEENISIKVSSDTDSFKGSLRKLYTFELDDDSVKSDDKNSEKDMGRTSAFESYRKSKFDDESQETDTLSPLPRSQFENHSDIFERSRGRSLDGKLETLEISGKSYERSSSSLEKRFPDMLLSPSMEDFANSVKKRSSDVLEDLRHLEAKTIKDGEIDPSMLTRKTSFIWEDLMNLEARRQDTFSDSASGFSRQRIDIPGISISSEGRKTYIVEPKINIDESSDSILKTVTYKSSNGCTHDEDDDDGESKLGVWTKVKPRKRNDNGRRSSDRALKIIQENSAILQKILTCQARKRLPDLEEISKEITISPINEEISKIFSPILEKMGLNEHEINEELARINFKDLDRNTTTTTASEFDAKINDELSKLSLIGDNEEVAYLPDVDDISTDYLVARDAFIDRQINEELSKLLANYEEDSPITLQKGSSSLNASDDLSTCSTNVYSYKSSNDSLDMKSDLGSKDPLHPMIYPDNPIPYVPRNDYTTSRTLSAKSDVDIYRELEKLDKISYAQALPPVNTEKTHQDIIPPSIPYISDIMRSPKIDYPSTVIEKQPTYDISPLKSPYDSPYSSSTLQTSTFDYKSRISPRKTPSNPYSVRSYEPKGTLDTGFENSTFELTSRKAIVPTTLNYEYGPKKHILSKEHLEFRVKYDQEEDLTTTTKKSMTRDIDLKLSPFQTDIAELGKGAAYYSNKQVITPTKKYTSNKDDRTALTSNVDLGSYESNYQRRTYDNVSPANKYSMYSENYDVLRQPYKITSLESETEVSSYLTSSSTSNSSRHRDLSPHYQYGDYTKSIGSSYATGSSNFDDSLTTTTMRTKTTYSDITPTDSLNCRKSNLTLGNVGESKQTIGDSDVKYNFDGSPSPKSLGFSPFPVRNSQRKPKELALKLGLYSPTNTVQSKRS